MTCSPMGGHEEVIKGGTASSLHVPCVIKESTQYSMCEKLWDIGEEGRAGV
jgi:hypothetical protein